MAGKKKSGVNSYLIPYRIYQAEKSIEKRFSFGVKETISGFRLFQHTDRIRVPDQRIVIDGSYFFEGETKLMLPISDLLKNLEDDQASIITLFVYSR